MVASSLALEPFFDVTVTVGRSVYPLPLSVINTLCISPTVLKVSGSKTISSFALAYSDQIRPELFFFIWFWPTE